LALLSPGRQVEPPLILVDFVLRDCAELLTSGQLR
jgi:hypothetical protein